MIDLKHVLDHELDNNEMNNNLRRLYTETANEYGPLWWAHYQAQTDPENGDYPANPYCLSVPNYYFKSDKRIMLVGQETNSWGGEFGDCGAYHPEREVTELMNLYDMCIKEKAVTTLLWRFGRKIEEQISVPFMFNNIAKVGWCGKTGFSPILQPHIISKEVSILKPNLIILATGPRWPYMKELSANGFIPSKKIPLLSSDGYNYVEEWSGLGIQTLWCCHPNYLQIQQVLDKAIKVICDYINDNNK